MVQQGAAADVDTGEWMADSYGFGVSFQYDNGQESQVTAFPDLLDASSMTDNVPMAFKLMVDMATVTDFDIRLNGINLYWTEDGNGTFDDPLWLGYWHWGTNTTDTSYFLTHEGDKQTNLVNSGDTYYIDGITHGGESTAGTVIKTLPAVTFELRNGWDNSSKSISSKYKTAVITNRRLYAGGIQSYRFDTTPDTTNVNGNCSRQAPIAVDPKKLDRMLKSPVNQFDVLPDENFIDVSVNDGESIVYLASFNDRILQFKEKNLHIINISGDYEYLEGQYKFLGIKSQTQVMTIETGVVWINELGCYFYNGEGPPLNLIDAGLRLTSESGYDNKFTGWNQFITDGSLIGYIKSQKQIVIFGESGGETAGDILIFDFPTQSWSFGKDKVSETLKSNIIQDYDNTCMYLANAISTLSSYDTFQVEKKVPGQNAVWLITQVNGYASIADSSLKIGSTTDITHNLSFASSVDASGNIQTNHNGPDQTVVSFGDYLRTMVESGPLGDRLQAGISGNTLVIAYSPDEIAIDDSLSGENLSFTSSPTGSYAVNKAADSPNDNMHLPLVHQAWTRQTAGSATGGPSLAYGSRSHLPDGTNNALILRFHPWDQHPSGGMPNLEIWNWNSYTSSYHMPTLLQHATLSGIAVHPDQGAINVHNPFAYTFNGNDGHPNSDGQNSATITSNRKCLNIDTTNYSRIEITKDSGNYSWGTNKLVLIFGRWADLQAAEGFITQYDGSDGYGLINYSLDEDGYYSSNAHFKDNWSSDVSVGNGTLLNDTSVFSTWGYNSGFHQGLGFGNTSNSNAHMSLPIQQDYAANSLKVPVVVFRKLNNPSELQISLLGDQTAYFSIGSKYSIVGGGKAVKQSMQKQINLTT